MENQLQSVTTEAGAIVEIKIKNDSDIEYINSRGTDISERVFLSRTGPRSQGPDDDLEKIPAAFEKLRMSLQSNERERSRIFHRQSSMVTATTSFSHYASAL